MAHVDETCSATLAAVAPGTELRDGLERILRGNTPAPSSIPGNDRKCRLLCTGGPLDVRFSATRLRGAGRDGRRHRRQQRHRPDRPAATQLVPDPNIRDPRVRHPTPHRRTCRKQTGLPVVSVSQSIRASSRSMSPADAMSRGPRARSSATPNPGPRPRGATAPARRRLTGTLRTSDRGTRHCPATSPPCSSGWRWSAGSARRSVRMEPGVDGRLLTLQLDRTHRGPHGRPGLGRP